MLAFDKKVLKITTVKYTTLNAYAKKGSKCLRF